MSKRILIEKLLDLLENRFKNTNPHVILEAPTGYGKSISGPYIYRVLYKNGLAESFIHVLPLRAIVRDIYLCTLINSFKPNEEICRGKKRDPSVLEQIRRVFLGELNISEKHIAYQMGEFITCEEISIERNEFRKEPLFDAKYVVTTLDSFIYNLFRVPVTEIYSFRKHYAIPRLRIFISAIYFDEAHMVFESDEGEEESTIYTAFSKALETLITFHTPIIIATATLGESIRNYIRSVLKNSIVVKLGEEDRESNGVIYVSDREFVEKMINIGWETSFISEQYIYDLTKNCVSNGFRVFIARDTVRDAIKTYRELVNKDFNEEEVVLLHGFMTRGDREKSMDRINSAKVLVATSVVEAGVNMSFDVLITDGGRIPSVIQRAGRICRDGECRDKARIYIVKEKCNNDLLDYVSKIKERGREICWRIPFDTDKYVGYEKLLDRIKLPKVDGKLSGNLEILSYTLFIDSYDINYILKNLNWSLVRTGLVEAIVHDSIDKNYLKESLEGKSYKYILENSLTLPLYRLTKLIESNCIHGYVTLCFDEEWKAIVVDSSPIKLSGEKTSSKNSRLEKSTKGKEHQYLEEYLKYLRNRSSKDKYSSICSNMAITALVIDRKCYERESKGVNYNE